MMRRDEAVALAALTVAGAAVVGVAVLAVVHYPLPVAVASFAAACTLIYRNH
jgi:hypothetical protein